MWLSGVFLFTGEMNMLLKYWFVLQKYINIFVYMHIQVNMTSTTAVTLQKPSKLPGRPTRNLIAPPS